MTEEMRVNGILVPEHLRESTARMIRTICNFEDDPIRKAHLAGIIGRIWLRLNAEDRADIQDFFIEDDALNIIIGRGEPDEEFCTTALRIARKAAPIWLRAGYGGIAILNIGFWPLLEWPSMKGVI
ncbi:hypothetical protein [Paracoccus ravus]|uniref:hypothetical protein n=1 Tax=Paracoccus ravus TaxID=2447760 RepID=UPI00106DF453|nr:hypothetical protein [Paracoccus ravus]